MAAVSIGSVEIVHHPIETHVEFALVMWREIPTVTAGGASVARTLQLARDGVFATGFPVTIRVTRAEWFRAIDVAQVRPAAGSSDGVVIDFGIARTVAAVATTDFASDISDAFRWLGANFDDDPLLSPTIGFGGLRPFTTEVRTERLLLELDGTVPLEDAIDRIAVQLPEIAADLELRIDGGPALWTSPGTVTAGELPADAPPLRLAPGKSSNGATRWRLEDDIDLVQTIDLADVLNALLGAADAAPADEREITLVLSARVPGAIALETPDDPDALLRHRMRITEGFVDNRRDLNFVTEGIQRIPFALPAGTVALHSAACTLAATVDAARTIPPTGPDATTLPAAAAIDGAADLPRAEFVLDADRAIALRLPDDHGLNVLSAVRVPLRPDKSGCEVTAVLLGPDVIDATAPGVQIDGAVGKPVTLEPVGSGAEQWVTLEFQTPVALPPEGPTFLALHFARGTATMAAVNASGVLPEGVVEIWRGAPTGPWEALPDAAGLAGFRGRLRLTGTAPADRPIAPLRVAIGREPTKNDGVIPSPKGVPVELIAPAGAAGTVQLNIVSLTPCTVSVRDVIVTVSR
jgi:hypothetical protein